ncbi:MAG: PAS domain S-box protein [Burkholderiales bacterium]|nr:PAS domain S-box protein [Burkholderiales bacterium]
MPSSAAIRDLPLAARPTRRRFHRILWITGVSMIVLMAAAQVYDVLHRLEIVVDTAERSTVDLARARAAQTAGTFQIATLLLNDVTDRMSGGHDGEFERIADHHRQAVPQLLGMAVIDADGRIAMQNGTTTALGIDRGASPPPAGERAVIRRLDSGATVLVVDRPWGTAGRRIAAEIDLVRPDPATGESELDGEIGLWQRDGQHLLPGGQLAGADAVIDDRAVFERLFAASDATAVLPSPADGRRHLYAIAEVPGHPFLIGIRLAHAAIVEPWREQVRHSAIRTTLLCLSVLLLMVLVSRELRQRERAEADLRVQTALLDELFESAPEAIVLLDLDRRVIRSNREFGRLFGHAADTLRGRPLDRIVVPPDLSAQARRIALDVERGDRPALETERLTQDGRRIPVALLVAPIVTAAGPIASYAIYRDLTEHRLAETERRRLAERLRHAEKLEVVGTMAGGVAHDFNNILAAILGYGEMALTAAPAAAPLRRYLNNVLSAAQRARALVEQILDYSRRPNGNPVLVDIGSAVSETLELARASLPPGVSLRIEIEHVEAAVMADPTQLHQVVMNLITNAVQAMQAAGTLTVRLDTFDATADMPLSHGLLAAGRHVRLTIDDTGCGMEPVVLERIFEPFFTTRESGSGLGLALVHGIVGELGGAIDVRSRVGLGSTFAIHLPRSASLAPAQAGDEPSLARGRGECILLVEDEKPLMLLTEEMLASLNYEPVGFTHPASALTAFRDDPGRFDGVVLDHLMPDMTGIELSRQLRTIRPDIPILLISGYTGPQLSRQAASIGIDLIVTKPLEFRTLSEALARTLASATRS